MTAFVPVPREVVSELLTLGRDALRSHHTRRALSDAMERPATPPWRNARNAVLHLRRLVAERGPKATAELDQLRSTIRDELDRVEVSLYDERSVYEGFVWTGLVTELAQNGYASGRIGVETYDAVREIAATVASALLEYVPPEVLS